MNEFGDCFLLFCGLLLIHFSILWVLSYLQKLYKFLRGRKKEKDRENKLNQWGKAKIED